MPKRKRMHRGGRPRQNKPSIDLGTPENQRRRLIASDPTLSTCPLDLALDKRLITQAQHDAAKHFLACRALVFGSPHPHAVDLGRVSSGSDPRDNAGAEASYLSACQALRVQSRTTWDVMENFLIYERFPVWLVENIPSRKRDHFFNGMDILHVWHTNAKARVS